MYYFVLNQCVSRDSQDGFSYICTTQTFVSAADIFEEDYKKSFILSMFVWALGAVVLLRKRIDGKDCALGSG